ncbi:MAG: peroxiredoxin [Armatimonadetes bacterium]|nr:peroxiredoxin [Armatimonadota bacterium]
MLNVGDHAPDFTLPNQDGLDVRLAEILPQGPLLLYFYPADFTPGCTRQACGFRDRFDQLQQAGLQLLGISPQPVESHRRFRAEHHLPFDLLADPTKQVIAAYQATGPLGLGVRRITYLISPDSQIAAATLADFQIARHHALLDGLLADPGRR